jgi:hypothetical protein
VGATVVERRMGAVDVVVELRDLLERGAVPEATALARSQLERAPATALPFAAVEGSPFPPRSGRSAGARVRGLTPAERTSICHRDGFVDRLSPERWRLVYPGALRILSLELRGAIDTVVSNGTLRSYAGNAPVWWDLWPTVDHLVPRAGGGTNGPDNLACVSWWRNAAKGDLSVEATGWTLQPAGDARTWDGLLGWFVDRVRRHPELAQDGMVRQYLDAAATVTEVPLLPRPVRPTRPEGTPAARRLDEPSPTVARVLDVTPRAKRCRKDPWGINTRGAYHSHERQKEPKIWEAGNGLWQVVQTRPGKPQYRLDRLIDGGWSRFTSGTNSDELLALAARTDQDEGTRVGHRDVVCWKNR